jgi:GNAT superfamily N-acetyltransferase
MRDRLAAAPLAGQSTIRCVLGPLAAASHAQRLTDRGASYGGVSNLLTLDLAGYSPTKPDPRISLGAGEERFVPGETIVRAVSGGDADPRGLMVANSYSAIPWMDHFLVRVDGEPAGGGALAIRDGLAFLTGTAVLPAFRGQHLQTALIQHRLSVAKAAGCKVAFVTCDVASLSQRNLERSGFRAAYPRISLKLPVADSGRP